MPLARKPLILLLLVVLVTGMSCLLTSSRKIDFNADIRPIFNKKCISCHGGVKQKGGFSVLFREEALANTESGKPAIIPGKPDESELIRRLTIDDPEERMPYKHDALSKEEIKLLRRWIQQGAEWGTHWAYLPVEKQRLPAVEDKWIRNDIDAYILHRLHQEHLNPSAEADKATLLRRASLDLTGLPPSEAIASAFLQDNSPTAYDKLLDQLLASPAYGEKWASLWLDLARYADTRGYEADRGRTIWRYRDWVIKAFNEDKPYDRFLLEQFAGDLLPNAGEAEFIATAFHRNTLTNDEGGTENEEFRTAAVIDRVNTSWSAVLGTSFNCVQCHAHPYDPFRHDDYYKFLAFFNNTRDEDTESEYPLWRHYNSADSQRLEKVVKWVRENESEKKATELRHFLNTWQPAINSLQCDEYVDAALVSSWHAGLRNNGTCRLPDVPLEGATELLFRYGTMRPGGKWTVTLDSLKGPVIASFILPNSKGQWNLGQLKIPAIPGRHHLYFHYYHPGINNKEETGVLFEWFRFTDPFPGKGKPGYEENLASFIALMEAKVETTPVMVENPPSLFRRSFVFERGNWLVPANEVEPDVPSVLNPLPNGRKDRMGLAEWLIDKKNPLTSRTLVNRVWEQLFGTGLSETLEDLGSQGLPPTHPELLDHLAYSLMHDQNWSLKQFLKTLMSSATYRQASIVSEEGLRRDPLNRFYARGPRIRLSAEQLRDQALAASGLLSSKMYGPSVMPYQPEGIWLSPYNGDKWVMSEGEDQYRRSLYTYWKRTAPYPSMVTFDAGAREVCLPRRIRTNTPLQALTTLNDSAWVVMARSLATSMSKKGGTSIGDQLKWGYEHLMFKKLDKAREEALLVLYKEALLRFRKDPKAGREMLGIKDTNGKEQPELAALAVVANALLNLDEWLTKN